MFSYGLLMQSFFFCLQMIPRVIKNQVCGFHSPKHHKNQLFLAVDGILCFMGQERNIQNYSVSLRDIF